MAMAMATLDVRFDDNSHNHQNVSSSKTSHKHNTNQHHQNQTVIFSTDQNDLFTQRTQLIGQGQEMDEEEDNRSVVSADAPSDVSTIPAMNDCVLKSTATSIQRSKDYADQLEVIVTHFKQNKGEDQPDDNQAHAVLHEIGSIMKKLEQDKIEIKKNLEKERASVKKLQERLDGFVEKRLKELPYAVQREHEACAVDIVELQWHVAFKRRQETRIKAKLHLAETLNEKLKNELETVESNDPKLNQKLQLESNVIVNLLQAHNETATELMKTLREQEKSEQECEKAEAKAEKERNYLKKEIDGVKKTLQKAKEDLNNCEKLHERYVQSIEEATLLIQETEDSTTEQMEKLEQIREIEKMQEAKVKDLEEKLDKADRENSELRLERDNELKQSEEAQHRRDQEKATLEAYVSNNERRQRTLQTENRNMKFENDDLQNQMEDLKVEKEKDDKNMERLYKELDKTETEFRRLQDTCHELDLNNKELSTKLSDMEQKTKDKEDFLDQQVENLTHQVREEVVKRGQIQTNIGTEKNNLANLEVELKKQKERMTKKVAEVESAVQKVTGQVEKMREKNDIRQKQLQELLNALEKLKGIHTETESKLQDKKSKLKPKLEQLKADDLALSKQLDQIEYMNEKLTNELREMKLGSINLNRAIRVTKNSIEDLTVELEETKAKCHDKQELIKRLEQSLTELSDRFKNSKESFKSLISDRKNFQNQLDKELKKRMKENEELASEYYTLRQKIFAAKTDFNSVYQQQLEMEHTLRSLRQVEFLQKRFVDTLAEYFKYRNLYFTADVEDIQVEQDLNEEALSAIRTEMESALGVMTSFLDGMIEGSLFESLKKDELEQIQQGTETESGGTNSSTEEEGKEVIILDMDKQDLSHFKILPPIGMNKNQPINAESNSNPNQAMSVC